MKGVIFCLLKKMVVTRLGAEAWDTLALQTPLRTAGGEFLGSETYPDADLHALLGTASAVTGRSIGDLLRAFGRFALPDLAALDPSFAPPGATAKSFLRSVDAVIHVEVHKTQPGTELPCFTYEDPAPDRLVMLYRSPRRLCDLVAGFIEGTADYFDEHIAQEHTQCQRDGDPACRFELQFSSGEG